MFDIAGLNSQYIIAVDIGGTNIRTALVHENGTIITENRERTPRDSSPEAVLGVIDGLMRQEEGYAPCISNCHGHSWSCEPRSRDCQKKRQLAMG